jgi:hypothetical protein
LSVRPSQRMTHLSTLRVGPSPRALGRAASPTHD